jgi:phage tail protein X
MAKNTEYITIQGDRWDTIALKAYGDASQINPIIDANPSVAIVISFEGGVRLVVPIIEISASTDKSLLPPWKRVPTLGEQQAAVSPPLFLNIKSSGGLGSFDNSFD